MPIPTDTKRFVWFLATKTRYPDLVCYRETEVFFDGQDYDETRESYALNQHPWPADAPNDEDNEWDDFLAAYYAQVEKEFWRNPVENWNRYSDKWPSPRGIRPIYEIIQLSDVRPPADDEDDE